MGRTEQVTCLILSKVLGLGMTSSPRLQKTSDVKERRVEGKRDVHQQ
jgi:hypothetical protein